MQSTATFVVLYVIMVVIGFIPLIGWFIAPIVWLLMLVLWLLLMYEAFKGERFKLPVFGDFAEKQVQ